MVLVPLSRIAHGRSGDKGNHANIAVIAYTADGFRWLQTNLTAPRVAAFFAGFGPTGIERYEAPGLNALNFFLLDVLAGGASQSLRIDTQGKTYASALLQMPIELPDEHVSFLRPQSTASSPLPG